MPRKNTLVTVEDLHRIIAAPHTMNDMRRWAKAELERRVNSGKAGGRPKKTEAAKTAKVVPETHIEPIDEGA